MVFHGVENFLGLALLLSRSYEPLAALAGYEARPGAAPARGRAVTSPAGLRARRGTRSRCAVRVLARRGGVGLRFPPPGFSPRRPPFGGAPFSLRIIGRGAFAE